MQNSRRLECFLNYDNQTYYLTGEGLICILGEARGNNPLLIKSAVASQPRQREALHTCDHIFELHFLQLLAVPLE